MEIHCMCNNKEGLSRLLQYNNILIQCHNIPDADTIACGFAIQEYLERNNKKAEIVYGGRQSIQKSGLLLMLEELGINIRHIDDTSKIGKVDLLVMVDCQPLESNTDWIECNNIAVIDHHEKVEDEHYKGKNIVLKIIDTDYVACSSIVWKLLNEAGFKIRENGRLATALYYGLYSDSNKFQTATSSGDEEMRANIPYNKKIIRRFQGSNISQSDLEIMLKALSNYRHNSNWYFAISQAQYCDPNILGLTSDTLIEVNTVDVCIVYCIRDDIIKLSVRSCTEDIKANELVEYITSKIPQSDGGGMDTKAGGKINIQEFKKILGENISDQQFITSTMDFMYSLTEEFFENNLDK